MKRIAILVPVMAAVMMFNPSTVRAFVSEEQASGNPEASIASKDECLLVAMNCPESGATIEQRIIKLQNEIARGPDVYTNDELRILINKLDAANKEYLELLNKSPGMGM